MLVPAMDVIIKRNQEEATRLAALLMVRHICEKPDSVLGLATGRTMEQVYAHLVEFHCQGLVDFSKCRTFNLDEYIGVPPDDPRSYRHYMDHHLFSKVNVDRSCTHLPDGMAADLKGAGVRYEADITACGGIDLQLLGIGSCGHIGFNEPLSAFQSRTRDKSLTPETLCQNAPLFGGDPARVPRRAMTMGVGTILEAKRLLLLATGATKAEIVAKAVEGPVTAMISATAIQMHRNCRVLVDEDAAAALKGIEYYRWMMESDPDLEQFS